MSELYVLASIPDQGKTTTSVLLEKKLRESGYSVACLQTSKGQYDVHTYLSENCYHYSIPLEAARSKTEFGQRKKSVVNSSDLVSTCQKGEQSHGTIGLCS